jgi:hypothetical protein
VSAADLVAPALAAGLGLSTSAGQLTADLQAYLRPRRLLLAVDNFEQVIGAAPLLAGLRSGIGDAAFEQAQAWGRSAGSTRAVEYALQQA